MASPDESTIEKIPEISQEEEKDQQAQIELRTDYGVEQYSVGNTLNLMFREVEEMPEIPQEMFERHELPHANTPEKNILRFYIKDILKMINQEPEVRKLRIKAKNEGYTTLSKEDKQKIFRVYDRARSTSLEHTKKKFGETLPDKVLSRVEFATGSDLNYGLRARILEGGEPEAWMILNPKLRKVDLLDSNTLYRFLRNSMNNSGHIKFVKQIVEEGTATDETKKTLTEIAEKNPEMLEEKEEKAA